MDLPGYGTAIGVLAAVVYRFFPSKEGALYNQAKGLLNEYASALRKKDVAKATMAIKRLNDLLEKTEFTDGNT